MDAIGVSIYLVIALLVWVILVRVIVAYRRQGGKIPIDIQRLLKIWAWRNSDEWPTVDASVTEARVCTPQEAIRNLQDIRFPPRTIEISFVYDANGFSHEGKFSVGFADLSWATLATRNAVGQKVKIRFNPNRPKECIPVENEWQGFRVWSIG